MKNFNVKRSTVIMLLLILTLNMVLTVSIIQKAQALTSTAIAVDFSPQKTASWEPVAINGYNYKLNTDFYNLLIKSNSNYGDGMLFSTNITDTQQVSLIYQPQDYSYRDLTTGSQDYLSSVQGVAGSFEENKAVYNNLFPNVALHYQTYKNSLKENFVINSLPRAPAAYINEPTLDFGGYIKYGNLRMFVEGIDVTGQSFTTSEVIEFRHDGEAMFYLPAPFAQDNNGDTVSCWYEVKNQGNQIWFYVRTPYRWLQTAAFPVTVDPTIEIGQLGTFTSPYHGSIVSVNYHAKTYGGQPVAIYLNGEVVAVVDSGEGTVAITPVPVSKGQSCSLGFDSPYLTTPVYGSVNLEYTASFTISASAQSGSSISPSGSVPVGNGDSQTFTYSANSGYQITAVNVDGSPVSVTGSYTFTNVYYEHSIAVYCELIPPSYFTITPYADGGGWISPSTPQAVVVGGSKTFSYGAYSGYYVSAVYVDGSPVSVTGSYTFSNVQSDHTIAVYTESYPTYTITPYHDAGCVINPSIQQTVNQGDSKTFTYTANEGYNITQVLVDGSPVAVTGSYTFTNVQANHIINITSTEKIRYSNLAVSDTAANKSVTFSSYWTDETAPLVNYTFSTNNTGTWTNDTASAFSGTPAWANVSKTLNSTIGQIVSYQWFAVDSAGNWNSTAIQTLTTTGYNIIASNDLNSLLDPNGTITVCHGANQQFDFSALDGYTILKVIINGETEASTTSPYIFTNITSSQTISISTSDQIWYVNATSDTGCTVTPDGLQMIPAGTNASFTFSANIGYQLYKLYINGTETPSTNPYVFEPTGNTTLYITSLEIATGQPAAPGGGPVGQPEPTETAFPIPTPEVPPENLQFGILVIVGILLASYGLYSVDKKSKSKTWSKNKDIKSGEKWKKKK